MTIKPKPKAREDVSPEDRLLKIAQLRRRRDRIIEAMTAEQEALLKQMEQAKIDRVNAHDDVEDYDVTGVIVRASTTIMDEPALRKRVGSRVWAKLTSQTLDKSKLDSALKQGMVQDVDLAAVSTEVPKKPYVKVTNK